MAIVTNITNDINVVGIAFLKDGIAVGYNHDYGRGYRQDIQTFENEIVSKLFQSGDFRAIYPKAFYDNPRHLFRISEFNKGAPDYITWNTDQKVIFDDWIWGLHVPWNPREGSNISEFQEYTDYKYTRIKDKVHGHHFSNFTIHDDPDWRPTMLEELNNIHSADARADLQINNLQDAVLEILELLKNDFTKQRDSLNGGNPIENHQTRLSAGLAKLNPLIETVQSLHDNHFKPAARVMIAQALIYGHGIGPMKISGTEYHRFSDSVSELITAETVDRNVKLANMLANLRSDVDNSDNSTRFISKFNRYSLYHLDLPTVYAKLIAPPVPKTPPLDELLQPSPEPENENGDNHE